MFISFILQTNAENLALWKSPPPLNHQAALFCCCNHSPFWNLISWSTADAILFGIIEVFFSPLTLSLTLTWDVSAVVFVIACLVLSEMEGWEHAEGPQKTLQSLSFNLTRRREVSWKRKYVSLLFATWELIHCLRLLTTPCKVLRYKHVPT